MARTSKLSLECSLKMLFAVSPRAFLPHPPGHRNDLHSSKHPAHTVTNNNVRAMVRIKLVDFGHLLAQSKCGIENGIASRIGKDPELITFSDFRVSLKSIDRLRPIERR